MFSLADVCSLQPCSCSLRLCLLLTIVRIVVVLVVVVVVVVVVIGVVVSYMFTVYNKRSIIVFTHIKHQM